MDYWGVAIIAALVIWGLAHFASAPGTRVKLSLRGVEYTKKPTAPPPTIDKAPTEASSDPKPAPPPTITKAPTEASGDPKPALPPTITKAPTVASGDPKPIPPPTITKAPTEASGDPKPANSPPDPGLKKLEVYHGLIPDDYEDPDDYEEMIKELRSDHDLRKLRPIESGRSVQTSPPGTYFFLHCTRFEKRYGPVSGRTLLDSPTDRLKRDSWLYFEVHHRSTGEFLLLAFLPESDADRVRTLTGDREIEITIAPRPRETFSTFVPLHLERIVACGHLSLPFTEFIEKKEFLMVPNVTVRGEPV